MGKPPAHQTDAPGISVLGARLLVFGTSAAVLVLEIVAGRLMAPYIGVSLETFTGIIGVVLAGIAAGAWLGGRAADRNNPRPLIGPLLVASGVLVLAAPSLVDILGPAMRGGRPLDIVLLTTVAFLLPSVTLSAVTPVVVKLRLRSLDETGSVVGSLSAIGTVGALAGTFITGFVLLSALPSRPMVLGLGVVIVLAGALMLVPPLSRRAFAGAVLLLALGTAGFAATEGPCEYETSYFCAAIRVDESRPSGRELWMDTLLHSYVDVEDPTYLGLRYTRVIGDVITVLPDGPLDAVFLGGGAFTLPRYLEAVRPGSRSTVLEIDGALVRLVEREFGVELTEDLRAVVGDARLSLRDQPTGSADLVVGDAFGGLSVPWHLTTVEFLTEIDRVLGADGVYVANVIDYPPLAFVRAETLTMFEVFEHVAVIGQRRALLGEHGANFILVGSQRPLPWGDLQAHLAARGESEIAWPGDLAREFAGDAIVLRDDFAPVDQIIGRP